MQTQADYTSVDSWIDHDDTWAFSVQSAELQGEFNFIGRDCSVIMGKHAPQTQEVSATVQEMKRGMEGQTEGGAEGGGTLRLREPALTTWIQFLDTAVPEASFP